MIQKLLSLSTRFSK